MRASNDYLRLYLENGTQIEFDALANGLSEAARLDGQDPGEALDILANEYMADENQAVKVYDRATGNVQWINASYLVRVEIVQVWDAFTDRDGDLWVLATAGKYEHVGDPADQDEIATARASVDGMTREAALAEYGPLTRVSLDRPAEPVKPEIDAEV